MNRIRLRTLAILVNPQTGQIGPGTNMDGKATSMIGLCQEGKSSPDALGRSAGVNSLGSSARRVSLSAVVPIRE
jgi:hypothetical protein